MASADKRPYRPDVSERRLTEDLEFRISEHSPNLKYARSATGPIAAIPVVRDLPGGVVQTLGYLWSANSEDAAGYIARSDAAPDSFNIGVVWRERLIEARGRGLSPEEAVLNCTSYEADPTFGRASQAGALRETTLADLKAMAAAA